MRGKAEEFNCKRPRRLRLNPIDEVDAVLHQRPIAPPCFEIEDQSFLAAFHRDSPKAGIMDALTIINKLSIGRLKWFDSTLLGHLRRIASFDGHFPHLIISAAIGSEVNPPTIFRPARQHISGTLRCDPARQPAFHPEYIDVGVTFSVRVESKLLPLGRPARRANFSSTKGS